MTWKTYWRVILSDTCDDLDNRVGQLRHRNKATVDPKGILNTNTAQRDFSAYIDNVLRPIVNGTGSNGELAAFLNRQLDEWELEAERPEGEPIAPLVIDALERILDAVA
jgi:hypothetical protein